MSNNIKSKGTEKKDFRIEVLEHLAFEGDMKANITSTVDMAETISSLFAGLFSDYYGCKIRVNDGSATPCVATSMAPGALYVDLYFKDRGAAVDGSIKNILPKGAKLDGEDEKVDLGSRFFKVSGENNGRHYNVTPKTYEALEEFMVTGKKTRWAEHTQEIPNNMAVYGNKEEAVVCITGLDLNKIISKIYGEKTEDGIYEYIALPSTVIPGKLQEFIMFIVQLDLASVRKLQNSLGIYSGNNLQFHQYNR